MPELKLGTKFECFHCGTKFYDLGKGEPICPKCGSNQKDASPSDSPSVSAAARRRRKAEVPKSYEVEEAEEPIDIADDEMVGPEIDEEEIAGGEEEEEEDTDDEA